MGRVVHITIAFDLHFASYGLSFCGHFPQAPLVQPWLREQGCRMDKAHARSACPVACTLDLIGDRWTLLIIRDMMCGKSRYSEFLRSPEKIATNILASRLKRLEEAKLVETTPHDPADTSARAGSMAYRLTSRGQSLFPVIESLKEWGLGHIRGTAAHLRPTRATNS
jgi:DNA-binding HxlR family transcriptional regulator